MFRARKNGSAANAGALSAKLPASASQAAPQPGLEAHPRERIAPSVIGRDLTILGNLVSKGEVQVEGEVQGEIQGATIVIGEHARITGGIVADEVVVRGQMMGSIRGKKVVLQTACRVEGDIYHQSLAIEHGAYFEGKSRRCEDPTAEVVRPDAAAMQGSGAPAQSGAALADSIAMPPSINV